MGLEEPSEPFRSCQLSSAPVIPGPLWNELSAGAVIWPAFLIKSFSDRWSEAWRSLEGKELLNQKRKALAQLFSRTACPHPQHLNITRESSLPSGIFWMFLCEKSVSLCLGTHLVGSP